MEFLSQNVVNSGLPGSGDLLEEVVGVLQDDAVIIPLPNLIDHRAHFEFGPIGRVIKQDKSAHLEEAIGVVEISFGKFIRVIAVDVTERDRPAERYRPRKKVRAALAGAPRCEELI